MFWKRSLRAGNQCLVEMGVWERGLVLWREWGRKPWGRLNRTTDLIVKARYFGWLVPNAWRATGKNSDRWWRLHLALESVLFIIQNVWPGVKNDWMESWIPCAQRPSSGFLSQVPDWWSYATQTLTNPSRSSKRQCSSLTGKAQLHIQQPCLWTPA